MAKLYYLIVCIEYWYKSILFPSHTHIYSSVKPPIVNSSLFWTPFVVSTTYMQIQSVSYLLCKTFEVWKNPPVNEHYGPFLFYSSWTIFNVCALPNVRTFDPVKCSHLHFKSEKTSSIGKPPTAKRSALILRFPHEIVALIHMLRCSMMCLAYFLTCCQWVFIQPSTARRSDDLWCSN